MIRLSTLVFVASITTVHAQPLPQPKVGQCPSGYTQSGGYCAPMRRDAPAAVPMVGQCPSGWVQSGAYCRDARPKR
jgi:hypothetical protein